MSQPKTTPMMAQDRRIKAQIDAETILFFRLGDFYDGTLRHPVLQEPA